MANNLSQLEDDQRPYITYRWVSVNLNPDIAHSTDMVILESIKHSILNSRIWEDVYPTRQPYVYSFTVDIEDIEGA